MIIGASEDAEKEPGIKHESKTSADVFNELNIDQQEHPIEPLFKGEWE